MKQETKVKICCISSIKEAKLAIKYGASALGLVGPMPSGPGIISNEKIKDIAAIVPPEISSFLLTSETTPEGIIAHHKKVNTNTLQVVDALSEGDYSDIRKALPHIKIVQVLHVIDTSTVEEALRVSDSVDALLLDSGNPNLKVKELGGTGRIHNWDISKAICASVSTPVYLAGGLHAGNVRQAINHVRPHGVDLCSGVRTDGHLDEKKLKAFFEAVSC